MTVEALHAGDAEWVADVMAARRELYERYSPVFWRPRPGAAVQHARFLRGLLDDPTVVAVRSARGLLIAHCRDGEAVVDDFAITSGADWGSDGRELLTAAWQLMLGRDVSTVRVVTAHADTPKVAMLTAARLRLVQQWWVLPVEPVEDTSIDAGRVTGAGYTGVLGPAPPVYDPGGPVLLADRVSEDVDPDDVARHASQGGAVLAVVAATPDGPVVSALRRGGWTVASDWYAGQPR